MSTSFKKKGATVSKLPIGTKPSLSSKQLLVSTGIPSLDNLIGGGLGVGTILLVEEDKYGTYSEVVQRLYLGEGVASDNKLFIATADQCAYDILKDIPIDIAEDKSKNISKDSTTQKNEFKIAWRYQNKVDTDQKPVINKFGRYFDLSNTLSDERIKESVNYTSFLCEDINIDSTIQDIYKKLLQSIKNEIVNNQEQKSILRISLQSLNSPLWLSESSDEYNSSLPRFLLALKSLLRSSLSCCMITMPSHLLEESYTTRIRQCCDTVIKLESFDPSIKEDDHLYKEYNGFFKVVKLARLNCIAGLEIDTSDLAFKLKRKRFTIEKIHLYPDISETVSRSQGSSVKPEKKSLEF